MSAVKQFFIALELQRRKIEQLQAENWSIEVMNLKQFKEIKKLRKECETLRKSNDLLKVKVKRYEGK